MVGLLLCGQKHRARGGWGSSRLASGLATSGCLLLGCSGTIDAPATVDAPSASGSTPGLPVLTPIPVEGEAPATGPDVAVLDGFGPGEVLFNTPVSASRAAPLSGGTLAVSRDGALAFAADPDRDALFVVDLSARTLARTVALPAGSEPGRMAEDAEGIVHVALRKSGQLVSVDPESGQVVAERYACPAPRGVAFDADRGLVHVACETGELLSFAGTGPEPVQKLELERGLRDVVVDGGRLLVSQFKRAEVLVVENGAVTRRETAGVVSDWVRAPQFRFDILPPELDPSTSEFFEEAQFSPFIAWRMISVPGGGALVTHQDGNDEPIVLEEGSGYGGFGCQGDLVRGQVSRVDESGMRRVAPLPGLLHTDIAVAEDGRFAAIAAGESWIGSDNVVFGDLDSAQDPCEMNGVFVDAELTSLAFSPAGDVLLQSREPAALIFLDPWTEVEQQVSLSGVSLADTGLALFHSDTGAGIACAACHAEGTEDGRVWNFSELGPRRTQSIAGGILDTTPLHWDGEFSSFDELAEEVMQQRMGGFFATSQHRAALARWIDALPLPAARAAADPETLARGQTAFETAACNSCHSGAKYTDNLNHDVGTLGTFQTPSLLGVADRAPFMHTGCAKTLADRFDPSCGGNQHGSIDALSEGELGDLIAFLEAL